MNPAKKKIRKEAKPPTERAALLQRYREAESVGNERLAAQLHRELIKAGGDRR